MDANAPTTSSVDLEDLYRRHGAGLTGAVRSILGSRGDVQEVLQDAMLRAWRALNSGTVPDDPTAWLFVITLNTARDVRRKLARRPASVQLTEVNAMDNLASAPPTIMPLERAEDVAAARAAIHRLDEAEKEVFVLRVSAELSFEAVAVALGIPVGTAKTRMRSALLRLRQILKHQAPLPEKGARA